MKKYGLHGKLTAQSGKGDELANILLKASELVLQLETCHIYMVSQIAIEPDAVYITEVWDTKADHDASLQNPAVRALISEAMPILSGMPTGGQELEVLGGYK